MRIETGAGQKSNLQFAIRQVLQDDAAEPVVPFYKLAASYKQAVRCAPRATCQGNQWTFELKCG